MASLTSAQRERFYEYCNENRSVCSEQVVQNFFKDEQNIKILLTAIDGEPAGQKNLRIDFEGIIFESGLSNILLPQSNTAPLIKCV